MSNRTSLTIVQMNDSHAYFDIHQEMFWEGDHAVYRKAGGYAQICLVGIASNIIDKTMPPSYSEGIYFTLGKDELTEVVGETATALNRGTTLESTMDNFLLQVLLETTGAQLAFSNGWRFGAPVIPGKITMNDLYNMIPMNPPVSTVELTGEELKAMLEENLERTFSCDPYKQMGGYVKHGLGFERLFQD